MNYLSHRRPERREEIAVIYGDQQLTYAELNRQANRLAHFLIHQGVRAEVPVAICMRSGFYMAIAVLGVFRQVDIMCPSIRVIRLKGCIT